MADVFISYSRLDHDRVRPIADRLTSMGLSIWWDRNLRAGQVFVDEIERQLDAARVVLTAWSLNARNSTWVYAESARGLDAQKLVQARLDNAQLPLPFDALQACDLRAPRPDWDRLQNALSQVARGGAPPEPVRRVPQLGPLATPAAAGSPKLLSSATTATLVAYAGALGAADQGVMSPEELQLALTGMMGVAGASSVLTAQRLLSIARAGG
ncbi:MAG: toll/interleukin-1 receptor domain-containing protein [Hyphomonadaceae bacterium]